MYNPEFRRYVWLELSAQRLVAMPVIIGLFILLLSQTGGADLLMGLSFAGYLVLVGGWGMKLANDSMVGEALDNTWDGQRMSALGPWPMVWGKLFGSTLYAWYGGLICLLTYIVTSYQVLVRVDGATLLAHWVSLLLLGICAQAFGLIGGVLQQGRASRSSSIIWLLLLLFLWLPLIGNSRDLLRGTLNWYGIHYDGVPFFLVSIAMFTAWLLLGAWRLMRKELQFQDGPLAWLAFLLWCGVYFGGFLPPAAGQGSALLIAFFIYVAFAYLLLFVEPVGLVPLRQLLQAVRGGRWQQAWLRLPLWLVTLLAAVIAGLAANLFGGGWRMNGTLWPVALPLAMVLFLLRDSAIVLALRLVPGRNRAELAAAIYLAVLYYPLYWLVRVMKLDALAPLFSPFASDSVLEALLMPGSVAVIVVLLVAARVRSLARIAP